MSTQTYDNHSYDLTKGPSPIIPLVAVVGLCLLLHGHSSSINLDRPLSSHTENSNFLTYLTFIPILLLAITYSKSHTIILPLALTLVFTYTVSTMLDGRLMLILIVCLAGAYLTSVKYDGEEELGWVCVLVLVFFLLHCVLSMERHQMGALVFAVVILLYFHCFT
ncbi:hypothetical protein CASFOL_007433 [Castilleja foliolosa]|uniref:Uncharacterized protein n=1 Tax=Castilleja foliolosa TaxID=1961234 RepID=A0ABD3E977_9LAMI